MRLEGLGKLKNKMASPGIKPVIFQLRYRVLSQGKIGLNMKLTTYFYQLSMYGAITPQASSWHVA
jgi:hypothetical protein